MLGAQGTQATGRMRSAHTSWGRERAAKVQGLQGRGRDRDWGDRAGLGQLRS